MLSAAYLIIALVDLGVLFWAAGHCLRYRSNGLLFATLPLLLLWYDNAVIAIGSTLGEGALLMNLNTVRFLAHYISLPMTFIALGAMAREAGFAWAKTKWAMGAFCVLATWFIGHDLWLFSQSTQSLPWMGLLHSTRRPGASCTRRKPRSSLTGRVTDATRWWM